MRRNKLALYLHLVWATWDRLPLLTPEIERRVYRNIESEARGLGCTVLAINGMPDHAHVALVIPTTITIANLVKQVKGVSSHFVNEIAAEIVKLTEDVKRQKEHHQLNELFPEWEDAFDEVDDNPASP